MNPKQISQNSFPMIDPTSLSAEWIAEKRKTYSKDPALMESMIHALYLLEKLALTGLEFIFKGGTSLILLLDEPQRFSIDIDIIINPDLSKEQLEGYLDQVVVDSIFIRVDLDEKRSYRDGIPKAHYKFIYTSKFANRNLDGIVISNPEREILLDVLFAENPYPVLVKRTITTGWLMEQGDPVKVTTPDIDSILGDKLTAFAPNTTGIPYKLQKEKEIIKQLFDIGCLFDRITHIEICRQSYLVSAREEIAYRPENAIESVDYVLQDTIRTALLIARREILKSVEEMEQFAEIETGIQQFRHFVFAGNFSVLDAQVAAAKAAYLAAMILKGYQGEIFWFNPAIPLSDYLITHPDFNFLNKRLKFVAKGEALFYWYQTIQFRELF